MWMFLLGVLLYFIFGMGVGRVYIQRGERYPLWLATVVLVSMFLMFLSALRALSH